MNPELLRAMANMLENPDKLIQEASQAKAQLLELVTKFAQERPQAVSEDMLTLCYGVGVILSVTSGILKQAEELLTILRMAHWLGKKEGRQLGHKQAQAERLFRNIKE